jgi:hypothetical protein
MSHSLGRTNAELGVLRCPARTWMLYARTAGRMNKLVPGFFKRPPLPPLLPALPPPPNPPPLLMSPMALPLLLPLGGVLSSACGHDSLHRPAPLKWHPLVPRRALPPDHRHIHHHHLRRSQPQASARCLAPQAEYARVAAAVLLQCTRLPWAQPQPQPQPQPQRGCPPAGLPSVALPPPSLPGGRRPWFQGRASPGMLRPAVLHRHWPSCCMLHCCFGGQGQDP